MSQYTEYSTCQFVYCYYTTSTILAYLERVIIMIQYQGLFYNNSSKYLLRFNMKLESNRDALRV